MRFALIKIILKISLYLEFFGHKYDENCKNVFKKFDKFRYVKNLKRAKLKKTLKFKLILIMILWNQKNNICQK